MANIWFVKEGSAPTNGEPYELTVPQCVEKLDLKKGDWKNDLTNPPRGNYDAMQEFRAPRYVVIEVGDAEAKEYGWKSGFYWPTISVEYARGRL